MTTVSILQISDLHRDPGNPIRNDALLSSLENDRARYTRTDDPVVRSPDIIIVSGDVIQGVPPGTADAPAKLAEQYREALDFLGHLTDKVLAGNRKRMVIVPGNHDVSACHFMDSIHRVDIAHGRKKEIAFQLFSSDSPLRWSWTEFELFEIIDHAKYSDRLAAFASFYQEFYAGTRTYSLDPAKQFDIFDFPEFDLAIAGFSSCYNNDIFNRQGGIHPGCIAEAGIRLRHPQFHDRLRIAVWHHNTEGSPMLFDYMDPGVLQNLIDNGFSLGFHGHQHKPQFLDTRFRYGAERRITVISAGTLCGSASYRFGRAYNIIELDVSTLTGRLHLREMQNDDLQRPIWGRRSLPAASTNFLDFKYDAPPEPAARASDSTLALLQAQNLYDNGKYREAADALDSLAISDELARRLLLDCLVRLRDVPKIAERFDPPVSATEAIYLMDALWDNGQRDRLRSLLFEPIVRDSSDRSVIEHREKYLARLKK
jgi:calcineurin-like phosphoesterase family protein